MDSHQILSLWVSYLGISCLTSQQHASVTQEWIYSDRCTCGHTEMEVPDQARYLTQSQHADNGPTSLSPDPTRVGGALECQV